MILLDGMIQLNARFSAETRDVGDNWILDHVFFSQFATPGPWAARVPEISAHTTAAP
jgi:hypothetical protein